jgi:hypothetical protein
MITSSGWDNRNVTTLEDCGTVQRAPQRPALKVFEAFAGSSAYSKAIRGSKQIDLHSAIES